MKRFLLFSGDSYYPAGGVNDFVRGFKSMESICQHLKSLDEKNKTPDWVNVLDIVTGSKYYYDRHWNRFIKDNN